MPPKMRLTQQQARMSRQSSHNQHVPITTPSTVSEVGPQFPFMELPLELRTLVYNLALEDLINEIEAASPPSPLLHSNLLDRGLLALLKFKRISLECSNAMRPAARAHCERHKSLAQEYDKRKNDVGRKGQIYLEHNFDAVFILAFETREMREYNTILRRMEAVEEIAGQIRYPRYAEEFLKKCREMGFRFA